MVDRDQIYEGADLVEAEVETARRLVREKPSTSYLQRRMQIPYSHAKRLMELLEAEGTVTANSAGFRKVRSMNRQGIGKMTGPTITERYVHLRENAEAFVETMRTMVAACEREGNKDLASKLRVWALMPWDAAIKADDTGDLWPTCEACGKPIKDEAERVSGGECDLHKTCIG